MKGTFAAICLLAITAGVTHAGTILSDDFAYPDGGIVTNSTWLPNTGTANSMLVQDQQLLVSFSRTEDIAKELSGGPYLTNGATAALYSSYMLKCIARPNAAGTYFSHFTGQNTFGLLTGHRARVLAQTTNPDGLVAGDAQFYLGVVSTSGGSLAASWPTPLDTNVTYTVVTRYVVATGESTLWIDPVTDASSSVTSQMLTPDDASTGLVNVGHYGFRQASGGGTMLIDNFKVGTSFSDVAGANTAPLISSIPDQSIPAGSATGPLSFTIQDAETAAAGLSLSVSSDNTSLVPTANIVLGGSAGDRTVTVTPAASQQGQALITVSVSDGANISSTSFTLRVGFPSISLIASQIVPVNSSSAPIPFTVGDNESAVGSLTVSATSSNPELIPQSGILLGGSGAERSIKLTPAVAQSGMATITVSVSDGPNSISTSFLVSVPPALGLLLVDTFSYPDGSLWLNGPWTTHASPTGTNFGQLQVTNGTAELHRLYAEDLAAPLPTSPFYPSNGVVIYAGFNIMFTELPTTSGGYFVHLKDAETGTTFKARVFANTRNAAEGQFRLGVANGAGSVSTQFPMDLSLGVTYGVVFQYTLATAQTRLWVNPVSESSTSVMAVDVTQTAMVGAFGLREDSAIGVSYLDNLKVSSSFVEVKPPVIQPNPIPLQTAVYGSNLVLTWNDPSFVLQSATDLVGPYANVPNATSPYTNTVSGSAAFFRLKY